MEELTLPSLIKSFDERGYTPDFIPKEIDAIATLYPHNIVCNKMRKRFLDALVAQDSLQIAAEKMFGLIHPDVDDFFKNGIKKGEMLLVTHCMNSKQFTSVVEFTYEYKGAIIFEKKRVSKEFNRYANIECSNVIALAKIPLGKHVAKRFVVDNDYSLFSKIAHRIFT